MGCCSSSSTEQVQKGKEEKKQRVANYLKTELKRTHIKTTTISNFEEEGEKFSHGGLLGRVREDVFIYCILPFLSAKDVVVNVAAVNSAYRGAASQSAAWALLRYPRMDPLVVLALALESETARESLIGLSEFWSVKGPASWVKFDLEEPEVCQLIAQSPMSSLGTKLIVSALPNKPLWLGAALRNVKVDVPDVIPELPALVDEAGCGGLESFESSCVTEAVLLEIARCSPDLRTLSLAKPINGTSPFLNCSTDVTVFEGSCLSEVASLCPQLVDLDVSGCQQLSGEALIAMSSALKLQSFVAKDVHFSSATLQSVLANSPSLTKLSVSGKNLAPLQVTSFLERCSCNLRHLDLGSLATEETVMQVAKHCPGLEHLDVSNSPGVTVNSIAEIGRKCPLLRHLGVSTKHVPGMGQAIMVVAKNCPRLEALHAYGGVDISNALEAFARHCPLLRELHVGPLSGMGEKGFIAIAKRGNLESVRMWSMNDSLFSDKAVLAIAEHCPNLGFLDVSNNVVTNQGIAVVAKRCPKLFALNVSHTHVTVAGSLNLVVKKCPQLRYLSMSTRDYLSKFLWSGTHPVPFLELLEEHCPHLAHVHGNFDSVKNSGPFRRLVVFGVEFS